jgi:hypothetical protein
MYANAEAAETGKTYRRLAICSRVTGYPACPVLARWDAITLSGPLQFAILGTYVTSSPEVPGLKSPREGVPR